AQTKRRSFQARGSFAYHHHTVWRFPASSKASKFGAIRLQGNFFPRQRDLSKWCLRIPRRGSRVGVRLPGFTARFSGFSTIGTRRAVDILPREAGWRTARRTIMARDWTKDVKRFVVNPDEAAIKGIIRYCGIALQSRDASFVACHDKAERDRVRDHFLKRKLAVEGTDAGLDQAVVEVCRKMQADRDKSRVTFYYLLAERFDRLPLLH